MMYVLHFSHSKIIQGDANTLLEDTGGNLNLDFQNTDPDIPDMDLDIPVMDPDIPVPDLDIPVPDLDIPVPDLDMLDIKDMLEEDGRIRGIESQVLFLVRNCFYFFL